MSGGWFGYMVSIVGCGLVVSLIASSTALLYWWAKVQQKRGKEIKARVRTLPPEDVGSEGEA